MTFQQGSAAYAIHVPYKGAFQGLPGVELHDQPHKSLVTYQPVA